VLNFSVRVIADIRHMRKHRNIFWTWWLSLFMVASVAFSRTESDITGFALVALLVAFFPFYITAKIRDGL